MKKIIKVLFLIVFLFLLGCEEKIEKKYQLDLSSIEETMHIDAFDVSLIRIKEIINDEVTIINCNESMFTEEDYNKLQTVGTHTVTIIYKLFSEQFSYSYMGPILPSVYFKFNCYGNEEIKSYSFDAKGNIYIIENNILNAIINYNLDLYGCLCSEAIIKESSKRNLPVEDIRLSDKEKVMLRSSKNE